MRMAEAVEGASAVLVCFSKKYQESDSCRKGMVFVRGRKVTLRWDYTTRFGNFILYYKVLIFRKGILQERRHMLIFTENQYFWEHYKKQNKTKEKTKTKTGFLPFSFQTG